MCALFLKARAAPSEGKVPFSWCASFLEEGERAIDGGQFEGSTCVADPRNVESFLREATRKRVYGVGFGRDDALSDPALSLEVP